MLEPGLAEFANDGALPFIAQRSSGTTGIPKLSLLTHEACHARLEFGGYELPSGPECRYLALSNISFNSVKRRALMCLTSGGCVTLFDAVEVSAVIDVIAKHRINYLSAVPTHAVELLKVAKDNEFLFPDLKAFRLSSTIVPEALRKEVQMRLTPNLYIGYGSSESGVISVARPESVRSIPGVVGNVVPGMEVQIIDDDGQPLPPGSVGKVRLRSSGMVSGYVNDAAETARIFRDGWLYPGDLAEYTPAGELIHHGRADDVMILDGINISPAAIENTLLQHPAVAEAAAFPIPSVQRGDLPIAAVATKSRASRDELLSHCRAHLGTHAPIGLMIVPKLPRNAEGKVRKEELVQLFQRQHARQ